MNRTESTNGQAAATAGPRSEVKRLRRKVRKLIRALRSRPPLIDLAQLVPIVQAMIDRFLPAEPATEPATAALPTPPAQPPAPLPLPRTGRTRPRLMEHIHEKLLAKAPRFETPIPTNTLIRRAGYSVNSWSRDKVTDLCVWGDLYRHPRNRGVSLPESG